jgi:hypothetical protein
MLRLQSDVLKDTRHGFFGRTGGVSTGVFASLNCGPGSGDDAICVQENRERVRNVLECEALLSNYQVHSADAVVIVAAWDATARPHADGLATDRPGIALGVLTADCAPVLFADTKAQVIGAAHAGWKGALAGVTDSTIAAMEKLGARRERIVAVIGPCISLANYEVDGGFHARFLEANDDNGRFFATGSRPGHWQFDLPAYVTHRLTSARLAKVECPPVCTYARDSEFFSFRRTTHRGEKDYGRQISAIALR